MTQGAHGTVTTDGTTTTYTPDPDYNGPDSYTYTITDDGTTNGVADPKSDTATVSVTVTEVNDTPTRSLTARPSPRTARSRPASWATTARARPTNPARRSRSRP